MSPPARSAQHLPRVLHHRGGELSGGGRGSAGGGAEENGVVQPLEGGPPAVPVPDAGQHLLERRALHQDQPQHQGGVPGRRDGGARVAVRTCYQEVVVVIVELMVLTNTGGCNPDLTLI